MTETTEAAAERIIVTLDLSHPDWIDEEGLSEVASCLRNLAYVDNKGWTHRARVARALADQIDAQVAGTRTHTVPVFDDPYGYELPS